MSTKISKGRWAYSFTEGRKAEELFKLLMESRGRKCVKTPKQVDIKHHIDFYVDDIGVDVKGNRHLDTIWLELKNVRGDKGWLQGKADYIAFDIVELESFCFFRRQQLYDLIRGITEVAKSKKDYMKLYTREGRADVIVKAKYSHIQHLQTQIISYSDIKD
jgi:hypothetical protein